MPADAYSLLANRDSTRVEGGIEVVGSSELDSCILVEDG